MRRRSLALVAVILSSACDPSLVTVEISTSEARSQVLVYVENDRIVEVHGVDNPADRALLSIPRRPGAQVYSIDYSCPLSGAGLKPGPITVEPQGVPLRRPLRVRRGNGERMEASEWSTEAAPPLVAGLKLKGDPVGACTGYTSMLVELPRSAQGAALLGVDRGVVALRTSAGFERFDTRTLTALPTLPLPAGAPTSPFGGATITDTAGVAYFFSRKGDFFRVGPDEAIRYSPAITTSTLTRSPNATAKVAGPPTGDLLADLFMVTEEGRVDHFDGTAWTFVLEPQNRVGVHSAGVVWRSPGSAFTVGQTGNGVTFIEGTSHRTETIFAPSTVLVVNAANLSPLFADPAFLTDDGNIWLRQAAGDYSALPLSEYRDGRVEVHAAFRHHLLYLHGGHAGTAALPLAHSVISQFDEELGVCSLDALSPFTNPLTALDLGGGDLLIHGTELTEGVSHHYLLRLTRTGGPARCDGTPEL